MEGAYEVRSAALNLVDDDLPGVAPLGTPEWWLLLHGLTNGGFAAAELGDIDLDGMAAWEEFAADQNGLIRLTLSTSPSIRLS